MPGGLRTARHCVFTGGVVTANGICGAVFCGNSRAAVSVLALSVIAARCQIPPFVAYATSSPGAGEVFPQRESLWQNWKVCRTAKASPFGRGGCDQREQTERASPLAGEKGHTPFYDRIMNL